MKRLKKMRNENGMAMSTVIIVGFILMSMTGATMTYAVAEMDISRHDQDWNAALAAAEGGIDDYIFRVNNDNGYWALGNADPNNPAMTSWAPVPGSANEGEFTYTVDTSHIGLDGTIDITSSGRVDDAARTVQASVRPRHFLDFLYFTDYETVDPIVYPILYGTSETWANSNCVKYKFGTPPRSHSSCRDIQFAAGDTIRGPLHSNDAILVGANVSGSAAQFRGNVTTNWAGEPDGSGGTIRWWYNGSKPNPFFIRAGDPRFASNIEMPVAVTELRAKALPSNGGCVYQGPTRIVLNSGGTMTVTSPLTPVGSGFCTVGSNRPLPANGVVYVDNVPTPGPGITPPPVSPACSSATPSRNRLGYPMSGDLTTYQCSTGDVFLKGQLNGRLTIAAKNRLIIVDDTTYASAAPDSLLGLIAENTVEIYHPVDCTSADSSCDMSRSSADGGGFFNDARVHAAILSLTHSFYVQNFTRGDRDNLDDLFVVGAIAQKFRGAVGTSGSGGTGYLKDYTYDQRLKYISPPEFLDPVNSAWQVGTWAEVQPNATHKARL